MRPEVMSWVAAIVAEYQPSAPVLEVGALDVNGSVRSLFPEPYTGLDMRAGPGVDVQLNVLDLKMTLGWNTIVCCETLEHVTRPQEAIERMYDALNRGGLFIGTTAFVFPVHDHPADYWRFTPDGLRLLLERAGFANIRIETEGEGPVGVFAVAEKP